MIKTGGIAYNKEEEEEEEEEFKRIGFNTIHQCYKLPLRNDLLIGMLLVGRSGLEEITIKDSRHYGFHLCSSFLM